MVDKVRQRNINLRSLVYSIDGPERAYPVYRLPLQDRIETPRHNPFTPGALAIDATTPPAGATTVEYPEFRFTASFGESTLGWSVISGALPPGLVLESDGRITGTPTDDSGSPYAFTVRVTDAGGQTDDLATSISVTARVQISLNPLYLPIGVVGEVYPTQTFSATGGTGPYTWEIVEGHIHDGLTFTAGVIDGTPTNSSNRGPIRVQVTDANGYTDSVVREVVIEEPAPPPEEPVSPPAATLSLTLEVGTSGSSYGYDNRNPGAGGYGECRPHTFNGFEVKTLYISGTGGGSFLIQLLDPTGVFTGGEASDLFTSVTVKGEVYETATAFFSTVAIPGSVLWVWSGAPSDLSGDVGTLLDFEFEMAETPLEGTVTPRNYYRLDWRAAGDVEQATFVTLADQGGANTYNGTSTAGVIRNYDGAAGFGLDVINPTTLGGNAELDGGDADGKPAIAGQFYHDPVTIATAEHPLDFSPAVLASDNPDGRSFDGIRIGLVAVGSGTYVDDDLFINATLILRDRAGLAPDVILTEYQNSDDTADNYLGRTLGKRSTGLPGLNDEPVEIAASVSGLNGHTGWDFTNDWFPVVQVTWQNPSGVAANDGLQIDVSRLAFEFFRNLP